MDNGNAVRGKACVPRVLMVEPNPELGQALVKWMHERELEVIHVGSAGEADATLLEAREKGVGFHGLLTDSCLLGMVAYRIMEAFQSQFPARPLALLTSSGDLLARFRSRISGLEIIRKPFDMHELALWCYKVKSAALPPQGRDQTQS